MSYCSVHLCLKRRFACILWLRIRSIKRFCIKSRRKENVCRPRSAQREMVVHWLSGWEEEFRIDSLAEKEMGRGWVTRCMQCAVLEAAGVARAPWSCPAGALWLLMLSWGTRGAFPPVVQECWMLSRLCRAAGKRWTGCSAPREAAAAVCSESQSSSGWKGL